MGAYCDFAIALLVSAAFIKGKDYKWTPVFDLTVFTVTPILLICGVPIGFIGAMAIAIRLAYLFVER